MTATDMKDNIVKKSKGRVYLFSRKETQNQQLRFLTLTLC